MNIQIHLESLITERAAINTQVIAMRQTNDYRLSRNDALLYNTTSFFKLSARLLEISQEIAKL